MSKAIINGEVISGSTSYASAITYTKEDGTKNTVQNELDELNTKIGGLKIGLNEDGVPGYYLPDGTFKPFIVKTTVNEFVSNVSYSVSSNHTEQVLKFNGTCTFNEELFTLASNQNFITVNKAGKYRITINANIYIQNTAESTCYLKKNGTRILGQDTSSAGQGGGNAYSHFSGEFNLVKGDSLVFYAKTACWSGHAGGCRAGSVLALDYLGE